MSTIASKWLCPDLQGCRVLLRMNEGNIEGVVADVSQKTARITLEQVTDVTTNQSLFGPLHFYAQDITSCVVLENSTRKKYILQRDEDGPRLLRVRPVPAHLEKLNSAQNNSEFICHREEADTSEVIKKGFIKLIGMPEDLPKLQRPIATDFEVIDEVNDQLSEAIAAIKKAQAISVAFEGVKVGRHGSLSVLAVATSSKVYIFDVQSLKKALFDHGLKEILESSDIEKIVHGCRHLSDCLHHQYQVGLNNVFDTMVADVVIYLDKKLEDGDCHLPSYVRGIQNCLRSFSLTHEQLKYTRSRQGSQEDEVCAWGQRPLSLRQIDALAKDVVYLGELAHACLKQMLQKFHLGVQFFLGLDRDCSEEELRCLPPDHILPMGFRDALKLGANRSAPQRHSSNYDKDCSKEYGPNGRRENNRFHHQHDNLRHGRGFSLMNNDRMHNWREPRDAYHREECNRKQDDHTHVKEDDYVEDSLLNIGMHLQAKDTSRELAVPDPDATRQNSESECRERRASDETAKPVQQEVPVTSGPEYHCPVVNGTKEDTKADQAATDKPHPNSSLSRSLEHAHGVKSTARQCTVADNTADVSQETLLHRCNGNRPLDSSPSHSLESNINCFSAERPNGSCVFRASLGTLMEHCSGSAHITDDLRDKPLIQSSSQPLSPLRPVHCPSVLAESKEVTGQDHNASTIVTAANVKNGMPKCSNAWGSRPVNDKAENTSFRPADMQVLKDSA
ncbi:uncharacterized protein LOC142578678 isoform X1 [Dermacentor variabilis]|uniref:uncharacterized protein LOC142578678 isoform X1 n=1 Tax=Dermacentor variabilis TaxID=34621 RepID=UPI003F5BF0AF